jgi:hypothetical protein
MFRAKRNTRAGAAAAALALAFVVCSSVGPGAVVVLAEDAGEADAAAAAAMADKAKRLEQLKMLAEAKRKADLETRRQAMTPPKLEDGDILISGRCVRKPVLSLAWRFCSEIHWPQGPAVTSPRTLPPKWRVAVFRAAIWLGVRPTRGACVQGAAGLHGIRVSLALQDSGARRRTFSRPLEPRSACAEENFNGSFPHSGFVAYLIAHVGRW